MTPREIKFTLRVHRADGRYAPDDPLFAQALAETARSPELSAWLEQEHALDATMARKLDGIALPAGLRETILAGARASRLHRPAWRHPRWLALAAAIAIAASIPTLVQFTRPHGVNAGAFAQLTIENLSTHSHTHQYSAPLKAIVATLSSRTTPFTAGLELTAQQLRSAHCAELKLGDRNVYEVCFERDGTWFHLYVTRLERAADPKADRRPMFVQRDGLAAASWSDGEQLYSLVTAAGPDALAQVI